MAGHSASSSFAFWNFLELKKKISRSLVGWIHGFRTRRYWFYYQCWWLPGKESAGNAGASGDTGWIHGLGRPSRAGNGNPLQYSCLENPMDRGAWRAAVHGVAESRTQLSDTACMSIITAISTVLILPLQEKQFSESKWLGQGHTAGGWQSQNWTVCLPVQHNFTAYSTAYPDHSISRLVKREESLGFRVKRAWFEFHHFCIFYEPLIHFSHLQN